MMDIHTATELAYKNGYAQGKADAEREIFDEIDKIIIGCRVDEYSKEFDYIVRQNYSGTNLVRGLTELEKKYMEGRT